MYFLRMWGFFFSTYYAKLSHDDLMSPRSITTFSSVVFYYDVVS